MLNGWNVTKTSFSHAWAGMEEAFGPLAMDDLPTPSFWLASHEVLIAEQVSIQPIGGRVYVYIYWLAENPCCFS